MTSTPEGSSTTSLTDRQRLNRLAVAITLAVCPVLSVSFAESSRGVALFMAASVLVVIVFVTVKRPTRDLITSHFAVLGYLALAVTGVLSYGIHPSGPGTILTFAMVVSIGMMLSIATYSVEDVRRYVAVPLLATTAIQGVIVAIQSVTGTAFGYLLLYPGDSLLVTNGDIVRPQGTYDHVYVAATVAVISVALGLSLLPSDGTRRTWFLVGIGIASSTIALTHSRTALAALALVLLVAGIASIRQATILRMGVIVAVVAFTIPALIASNGWAARIDDSIAATVDDASLGRVTLAKQAISLARDHPVVGVGPNRYMDVLEERGEVDERFPYVVHNVPLIATAELGIPAGIAITVLFALAGFQAWRARPRSLVLYVVLIPLALFDVVVYNRPLGLLLLAVWCGVEAALVAAHTAELPFHEGAV